MAPRKPKAAKAESSWREISPDEIDAELEAMEAKPKAKRAPKPKAKASLAEKLEKASKPKPKLTEPVTDKKPRGRPTLYTREIADEVCQRMADGETLSQICKDDRIPARTTVVSWHLQDRDGFSARYDAARDAFLDGLADECMDIADDGTNDWTERETEKGRTIVVVDHENISRSKLRVDTRRWLLSKLRPETYGDRLEVGGKGGGPIVVNIRRFTPEPAAKVEEPAGAA